jgi:hypothetical protein
MRVCDVSDCGGRHFALGFCQRHYWRVRTYGDPGEAARRQVGPAPVDPITRLLRRVEIDENGCWVWQGAKDQLGYGWISVAGKKSAQVHRFAYQLLIGPVPPGKELDHSWESGCRSKACLNVFEHIEPVTHQENILRYFRRRSY